MKRKMKRIAIPILVFAIGIGIITVAVSSIFENPSKIEPEFVLCYGEVNATGHTLSDMAYYFAECVKELSGGKIIVEVYPSGQLGDDEQCYQAMQMGALDFYRGNCASFETKINSMVSVMSLPYLFEDSDHFWKICDSDLGNEILGDIHENYSGMRGLAFLDEGARSFMTTDVPLTSLEDMTGLRMRTQSSAIMMDTVESLGAEAFALEYVEVYSALEAKTIDGAENPLVSYYYNRFYEVAPYYIRDEHTYSPSVLLISEITWNAIGEEYQQIIMEAAKKAQAYNKETIKTAEQDALAQLENKNVHIYELKNIEQWREAVQPVYDKYGAGYADVIRQIEAMKTGDTP